MSTIEIKLPRGVWSFHDSQILGSAGGFGVVYAGKASNGSAIAVKLLNIDADAAAHRELAMSIDFIGRDLPHVMPVLDAGQDAESDRYYVVMPVAERSLEAHLRTYGAVAESEAVPILLDIVAGLEELPNVVHRDLKPANILMHDGRWRIADFGIARFVEESTSVLTLKNCLSPPYAAPEQWRQEHATRATDIYALGCIAHAIVTGQPPFTGAVADLQAKHLGSAPPAIPGVSSQFQTVVSMMLRKHPDARPTLPRIRHILTSSTTKTVAVGSGLQKLAAQAAEHEKRVSLAEAQRLEQAARAAKRSALADEAKGVLEGLFDELARRILAFAPSAKVQKRGGDWLITIAGSALEVDAGSAASEDAFRQSKWDVVRGAAIEVRQGQPEHKRSASLWYTRQNRKDGHFRWYEVGYGSNPLSSQRMQYEPCAVSSELADRAHAPGMDIIQCTYGPIAIDDEEIDAFCDRWVNTLAEACAGRLQNLSWGMPDFSG